MSVASLPRSRPRRLFPVEIYCILVGTMDLATGLLLVAAPRLALGLMRVQSPPEPLVLLRWIGVFVAAVGAAYLYPFLLGRDRERRSGRLATVLEVTTLERFAVGSFVATSLAGGSLEAAWASVAITDLLLAALQLLILWRGWLG